MAERERAALPPSRQEAGAAACADCAQSKWAGGAHAAALLLQATPFTTPLHTHNKMAHASIIDDGTAAAAAAAAAACAPDPRAGGVHNLHLPLVQQAQLLHRGAKGGQDDHLARLDAAKVFLPVRALRVGRGLGGAGSHGWWLALLVAGPCG